MRDCKCYKPGEQPQGRQLLQAIGSDEYEAVDQMPAQRNKTVHAQGNMATVMHGNGGEQLQWPQLLLAENKS